MKPQLWFGLHFQYIPAIWVIKKEKNLSIIIFESMSL